MATLYTRVTFDKVVSKRPVKLYSVILTPSSASKRGDMTLYDGESTGDDQIVKLLGASGTTTQFNFNPPLQTQRGLFVDKGGDVGDIMIQYTSEKE